MSPKSEKAAALASLPTFRVVGRREDPPPIAVGPNTAAPTSGPCFLLLAPVNPEGEGQPVTGNHYALPVPSLDTIAGLPSGTTLRFEVVE